MARVTSRVEGDRLTLASNDESSIIVGTPRWFEWLESATTFSFTSPSGRFTARKEARARGGLYWKAYHTANGTLHRAYLGKSADITLGHLTRTAATLWAASASPGPSTSAKPAPRPASANPPSNLLTTKLNVPPARDQLVTRSRLFERLEVGLQGKLTLIAAPAGFGKTTLLSAWRATEAGSSMSFAWVSLDSAENDPVLFWTYVLAAIDAVTPGAATSALALLQSPQPPPTETILTALLNEIPSIPDPVALVLDDYHVIDSKLIDQALTFLIEHMPPRLHLVITTRHDPQLSLARLRARGQLTELRASDLRFTPGEAATFLNHVMGLSLSADDVTALETRTEGWIAGLQLAALSLQGHQDPTSFIESFTGNSRFIIDYLAEEVLERQPPEVQTFLLHTSILDRLCGPLCDALLPAASISGQETLEYLEHANMFIIPLDNERCWYRYHHLFADLLRQRLHQRGASFIGDQRKSVAELHIRASQWYEDNGLEIEAFHHAATANDFERAERLIEGKGVPLYFRGAGTPVRKWLELLPTAALDARPSLWVTYASALMTTGQTTAVEEKLKAAEAALHHRQSTQPVDRPQDLVARDLVGRIASMRATSAVMRHDVETIVAQSHRALEYLDPNNLPLRTASTWTLGFAYQLQGDRAAASRAFTEVISISKSFGPSIYTTAATLCLGQVQETDNQLNLAAETYRRVILLAGDPPQRIVCEAYLGLARICYQWNDLDAAEQHAQQCMELTRQVDSIETIAGCGVFLARLRLTQEDVPGAVALLAAAYEYVRQHNFVFRMPDVAAAQVLTLLHQGNLAEAAHLAQTHNLPLSQARVYLAQGDPSAALAVLEPLRQQMEEKDWEDERLKVMLLQAIALQAHGEGDKAVQLLGELLALAEPGGFTRIFVDEGVKMATLLSEAAAHGIMPKYISKLLAAFEAEDQKREDASYLPSLPPTLSNQSLIEPLSQREIEVLQLMAQGLSNREISERLFLALSTVKGHNLKIFGKLQVQRRTEAVARARELDMLLPNR